MVLLKWLGSPLLQLSGCLPSWVLAVALLTGCAASHVQSGLRYIEWSDLGLILSLESKCPWVSQAECLNLSTIDILAQIILCWGPSCAL